MPELEKIQKRRELWIISTVCLFHSLSSSSGLPIFPLYVIALGGSPWVVGVVIASAEVLPALFALSAGALADRTGPKTLVHIGTLTLVIGTLFRLAAQGVTLLFAAQAFIGLSNFVFLAAQSQVALISEPREYAQNFGAFSMVTSAGQTIGPLLGGAAASVLVRSGYGPVAAYRGVFLLGLVLGTVALCVGLFVSKLAGKGMGSLSLAYTFRAAAKLIRAPRVMSGTSSSLALVLTSSIRRSFFPVYASSLGFAPAVIGFLVSSFALAGMATRPFLGWMARRQRSLTILSAALGCCALGWAFIPLVSSVVGMFILIVIAGVGMGIGSPLTMVLSVEGSARYERGLGLGIRQLANRLGDLLGPTVYGSVAAIAGLPATFFLATGFSMGGLVALSAIIRWRSPVGRRTLRI